MKQILLLLLSISIVALACKKDKGNTETSVIKGTWELRATRNGNILPATYAAGNGHLLVLSNANFAQYTTGAVVDTGSYTISTDARYQYTLASVLGNSPFIKHISLVKDTLELFPGQPDISTSFYVKKGQ